MGRHEGPVTLALGHPAAWSKEGPGLSLLPMCQYPPPSIDWFTGECTYPEARTVDRV